METIRYATSSDAKALAALAEETFRDTFGAMNTAENMDLHCGASYSEAIQAAEIADTNRVVLVVEYDGALVAYAQLRWSETLDFVPATKPGEIQRLYVAKSWHGKGLAQGLMVRCLEELVKRGSDVAWLGVWEHNPRAITFYQKFQFAEVGSHVFPLGTDPQRDIILVKDLSDIVARV